MLKRRLPRGLAAVYFGGSVDKILVNSLARGSHRSSPAVETPVLAVLGARERKSREDAERELSVLGSNASRAQSFATAVVDGDHLYTGVEQQVAAEIARWIASRHRRQE